MFNKTRFKRVLLVSILLILVFSTFAKAIEVIYEKKFTAVIGRIKFKVDGKDVTKEIEEKYGTPAFVVKENNRSYVPLRSIAELMGLKVEWDGETHTAEIIDVKSMKYEEELEKYEKLLKQKDEEIAKLKEEIEKLKEKETDLEALEKKINNKYGTYRKVNFDITLKEDKNAINVEIEMDLKDSSQRSYWGSMTYSDRKSMIEDIVDIISKEYTNTTIQGSVYDLYYKKDFLTFKKPKSGKLTISHDDRYWGSYDEYVDDVVYEEFYKYDIIGAYMSNLDITSNTIYFDINIPYSERSYWWDLTYNDIEYILDRISNKVSDYYDDEYRNVIIEVYLDDIYQGEYIRYYDEYNGRFYED